MNFGERLKDLRTDKGLTQPQFAALAGIEQSYLSKLENDKSIPSAEMFDTIVSALGVDAATFLQEMDRDVIDTTLRHVPAVSQFKNQVVTEQVHQTRRWLFGSAGAWLLGFAIMLAANDGIFFPNNLYVYKSPGVFLAGEGENVFDSYGKILALQQRAKLISNEEASKLLSEFTARRERPLTVEWPESRGTVYYEATENGKRRFELTRIRGMESTGNRMLQYIGALVFACGFAGIFIEWRLRRLKNQLH
ncbi:helix-turn-helix domain-containing protein [Massilia sp. IC2-477]|uniref:helix-turn-helix domain-containing protein n=1 Tax=Massilia sp. IC2-477 TaxID=2887198 RepID=UPI001D10D46E|nr:helix-turn-helix domain-containing protein [Massilia sp. IC2-477]MCC2958111.1 helix-turn-helix domain-containing protein [Massilia sp. IC2-477]